MRPPKDLSWTRALGIGLLGLALSLALDPDYPLAEDEIPMVRVPMDLLTKFPVTTAPHGAVQGVLKEFRWSWQGDARAWQVVVLDRSAEELLRSQPVSGDRWRPSAKQAERLEPDQRLYWYVSSGEGPRRLQSDLGTFTLSAARNSSR